MLNCFYIYVSTTNIYLEPKKIMIQESGFSTNSLSGNYKSSPENVFYITKTT